MGAKNKGANTNVIHILSDFMFSILAFLTASTIAGEDKVFTSKYIAACLMFTLIYVVTGKEARMYNVTTFFNSDRIIKNICKAFFTATGATTILLFYVGNADVSTSFYVAYLVLVFVYMYISAFVARFYIKKFKVFAPRTLLVGSIERFAKFNDYLERSNIDMEIVGYVSIKSENKGDSRYLGIIYDIEKIIHEYGIDDIYIMQRKSIPIDLQPYITLCMSMGVTVRIIMDTYQTGAAQSYVSSVGTYPVITYHTVSLNSTARMTKRFIDIVGSIFGIIISSPIMLITAILVSLDGGPVIFKQERVGLNGRHFYMYKFRSMCVGAEKMKAELLKNNQMEGGYMFKLQKDPRVTKVGKVIRRVSIDELPQFFNVLKGEMSLVGTRPPTLDEVELYESSHWRRMSIKPGITGMWQVSGRSRITDFDEIVALDTQYIDQWNVLLDLKIMFKTVVQLFTRNGAY